MQRQMILQPKVTKAPCLNAKNVSIIMKELVTFQDATNVVDWVIKQKTVGEKEGTEMEIATVLVIGTMVEMEMAMVIGMAMELGRTKDASVVEARIIS